MPRVKNVSLISKLRIRDLILPGIIVTIVIIFGIFRGQFVVATINGEQLSRLELIGNLEKQQGKTVLDNLIIEKLILQEAKSKKIAVSDNELNQEIQAIEKNVGSQGQKLDDLLNLQGMSRDDLKRQLKIQLILKKLVGTIKVEDKDVTSYMEKNKESLPEATVEAELKQKINAQLVQQKTNEKIQSLISDLKSKAKIKYLLAL